MQAVYVLNVRLTTEEIQCIHKQWSGSLPDGRLAVITPSATQDTIAIITKLSQPARLLRELRLLKLSQHVTIFRILGSVQDGPILHAWCTYQPMVIQNIHIEPDIAGLYSSTTSIENSRGAACSPEYEKTGKSNDDRLAHGVTQDNLPNVNHIPRLLQHESTADPSSIGSQPQESRIGSKNAKYACQRTARLICANEALASQLHLMKLARTLQGDWIGERAYSSALASIRAVEESISCVADVSKLEGCGKKIIDLISEWLDTGKMREVEDTWDSSDLNTLLSFWNCHGVGAVTARGRCSTFRVTDLQVDNLDWFYNKGYRDLNDAIQDWDQHSRSVQIGLKHYDDFLKKIPRKEVQYIGELVAAAANKVVMDTGSLTPVTYEICGGYRRGKDESGDVDVLLTHETCHGYETMLQPLLKQLEESNCLKHIISAHLERDASKQAAGGLSIALVVIIPGFLNHKVHRRLDIIVCPPRAYVTAITGWSGSTTLERDLRRYASEVRGLTFDSTGLSDPVTRARIDDTSFIWHSGANAIEMEQALFAFLGLDFIPPTLRNAG